jgi:hypothetical protein
LSSPLVRLEMFLATYEEEALSSPLVRLEMFLVSYEGGFSGDIYSFEKRLTLNPRFFCIVGFFLPLIS